MSRAAFKTHYVYVSYRRDTRQFYIGCRSTKGPDDDYFGSGIWPRSLLGKGVLEKEILRIFPTRAEAGRIETRLIRKFWRHPLCMNDNRKVLCDLPPPIGFEWPVQYHESGLKHYNGGIVRYLETHWAEFFPKALIDMGFLKVYYPSTVSAIYNYRTRRNCREHGRRELPRHVRIPKESLALRDELERIGVPLLSKPARAHG